MRYIYSLILVFFITISYGQSSNINNIKIKNNNIDKFIEEVYNFRARGITKNNSQAYQAINTALKDRIVFFESYSAIDKAISLDEVELFNKYNSTLKRDMVYDLNTFNPLKYNLPFFSNHSSLYRLGETDYYLLIKSQNLTQN